MIALGAALLLFGSTASAQTAAPPKTTTPETAGAAPQAAPAPAPAPAPPTFTFGMKGFVSLTGGFQSGTFSPTEGQLSNFATTANGLKDKDSFTFDVRHSRFNFSVKGPKLAQLGAIPSGILEIDFMGGFGAGANGSASLVNRLRIAVVELSWGAHRLQFGQQNDLIFAMAPTSLSHIGQPLGYGTGNSGFRRPGVFGFHNFPVAKDVGVELAWEVARGSWNDPGSAGIGSGAVAGTGITQSEASASPAFEARATLNYTKLVSVWVAGHQHRVDLTSVGNGTTANVNTLDVASYNAGAKLVLDAQPVTVTLQGTGFMAQNGGPLAATLGNGFKIGPRGRHNVNSQGWWAQCGLNFTKEFSLWGLYGQQKVDEGDFVRAGNTATDAMENATTNVIAMYRDGGMAFSLEWINFNTKYAKDAAAIDAANAKINATRTAKADQYLFSANYFF